MKVVSIDIFALKHRGSHQDSLRAVCCRINTDDGAYGYGECGLSYGRGAMAGFHMIKELAPLIIGQDPMRNEYLWERMFKDTFWGQAGGAIFCAAMSAIDMALFDIKCKVLNVPAYQLLGGKQRDELRCYASQLQLGWVDDDALGFRLAVTPEQFADEARRAVADGYDAIKTDFLLLGPNEKALGVMPRKSVKLIVERIRATREAVGPDVDIIIENHSKTDALSATLIGQAAEEYGILYYEEVATPLNTAVMQNVARKVNIPIANGERLFTRWGYLQFLLDDSIQVVQPDICLCGGITEAKKICDMAHVFDATVQLHVCGSPLTLAASLQLEAAIPNFCIHEHHVINKVNYNRELGKYDYAPANGKFTIPELPGFGQELSEYAIRTAYCETVR